MIAFGFQIKWPTEYGRDTSLTPFAVWPGSKFRVWKYRYEIHTVNSADCNRRNSLHQNAHTNVFSDEEHLRDPSSPFGTGPPRFPIIQVN